MSELHVVLADLLPAPYPDPPRHLLHAQPRHSPVQLSTEMFSAGVCQTVHKQTVGFFSLYEREQPV